MTKYKNVGKYFNKIIFIFLLFETFILININIKYYESLNEKILMDVFQQNIQLIKFENKVKDEFKLKKHVNLNEIESTLPFGRKWEPNIFKLNAINVGLSLDYNYLLETIITTTSLISSQKISTKIRLHFSIVKKFIPTYMIKIYSLRFRFKNDVEFNFYDASRVEDELNTISYKGPGLAAKLLLPQLVDESVKRLILIDSGDLLVLKDLSEMYNWNMKNYIYMGAPDIGAGVYGKISNKIIDVYINVGHYLIDVEKVKKKNMYNLFLKYKNVYKPPFAEQLMLNDIANGEIGYLPVEFGLVPPFKDDILFYKKKNKKTIVDYYNISLISQNSDFIPKTYQEFLLQSYNPIIVHGWNGKWVDGKGMNIYRKLCQYFIELSGMKKEICGKRPGYCQKN